MVIGTVAAVAAIVVVLRDWGSDIALKMMQEHVFSTIGVGLAVAAAVELAYTLFTDGPDEALDPLMLGLSAALILQLGHADRFAWTEGLAAILYVGALAGLFVVRRRLADVQEPDDYEPSFVKAWREWKSKA
jgi:drug/metabolite transporter (DMT)-like permease